MVGNKQLDKHYKDVISKTWNFSGKLKSKKDHFLNAATGFASEAGEALDVHKKIWFHSNKTLKNQREAMLLEVGDVFYYGIKLMYLHGFTLREVLAANKRKLAGRHPELGMVKKRFAGGK